MLWHWARRRHPNKGAKWVKAKYFTRRGGRDWMFTDGQRDLLCMFHVPIIRHTNIQGDRSPYRVRDVDYFEQRKKHRWRKRLGNFQKQVVDKTGGRCGLCARPISEEHFRQWWQRRDQAIRLHLMIPEILGGHHTVENVFVVHRLCPEQYHRKHGHDTMPDNPQRFLAKGEGIAQGRVVWDDESKAANN